MSQEQDDLAVNLHRKYSDVPGEQVPIRDLIENSKRQPKPLPILEVNWGEVVPMLGADLTPEFVIRAPGHYATPFVYFWKDTRIDDKDWEEYPIPRRMNDSQWCFHQQLCLETKSNPGVKSQYHLQIKIIFPENDGQEPHCYCGIMKLVTGIVDTTGTPHSIKVDNSAVISIYGLKGPINVDAENDAVISIDGGHGIKTSREENSLRVTIPLAQDVDMTERTPKKRFLEQEHVSHEYLRLVLEHPDGRTWHLFGEQEITIGRHSDNHISLQWLDHEQRPPHEDSVEYILGTCISRRHCSVSFENESICIEDRSTMGTFVRKKLLTSGEKEDLGWEKLPIHFDLAGISRIRLSKMQNHCVLTSKKNKDFPDQKKFYQAILSHGNEEKNIVNWELAEKVNADSICIQRIRKLVAKSYRDTLKELIPNKFNPYEFFQACEKCREDIQADKERYFFVLRSLSLGSASRDGIFLNDQGVKKNHGQIFCDGNGFWIENLKQDGIAVNDIPLKAKELVRLTSGMTLTIGTCVLAISGNKRV